MNDYSTPKQSAISQIRKAKGAHMRWRAYAQALVSGVDVPEDKIPVAHTECAFGRWYHGEGQTLLGHLDSYEGIAVPHEMLHAIYQRIYQTLNVNGSRNPLGGLFGKRQRFRIAHDYMDELIGVSETLIRALEMLEQEVRDLPDEQ